MIARRRGPARRAITIAGAALALVVAIIAACFPLFVFPSTDEPREVDAIIVLGPPREARIQAAQQLIADGYSDTLVIAVDDYGIDSAINVDACSLSDGARSAGTVTRCLIPEPFTTAGEALMVERLAAAEGWETVMVVTNVTHISRARMIFTDCLGGGVLAVADGTGVGDSTWAWQFLYQSGAFVKALVSPTC
ncbi:YdcF family protein [Pseudoclavibacter sp. RFBA6]|uniref:YdcF family protein n=1 Tax=Pseudoclavibacter sp. RFBA6 TaxID=2080573 RepID=UPI0015E2254B|nr:YdcF family protein [Pseudoclavibacter sp. RFBA6]